MPSLRKSQSARENGAKSQGPTTETGRRRSSQNAIKHGLTAQTLVLPSEDPADFERLLDSYLQQFRPSGPVELDLIHEIVAAKWRLNRLALIETQLLAESIAKLEQDRAVEIEDGDEDEPLTPIQALTNGFVRVSSDCSFLYRLQGRLERAYSRALRTLLQVQTHRGPSGPSAAPTLDNEICTNEPTNSVRPNGSCTLQPGVSLETLDQSAALASRTHDPRHAPTPTSEFSLPSCPH